VCGAFTVALNASSPSGCSEMLMAKVVTDLANRTPGKEAVAMESFAKALRMVRSASCFLTPASSHLLEYIFILLLLQLPTIIADNAGYDSADLVAQLRAAHQEDRTSWGLSE